MDQFPPCMLLEIGKYLDYSDVLNLQLVDKSHNSVIRKFRRFLPKKWINLRICRKDVDNSIFWISVDNSFSYDQKTKIYHSDKTRRVEIQVGKSHTISELDQESLSEWTNCDDSSNDLKIIRASSLASVLDHFLPLILSLGNLHELRVWNIPNDDLEVIGENLRTHSTRVKRLSIQFLDDPLSAETVHSVTSHSPLSPLDMIILYFKESSQIPADLFSKRELQNADHVEIYCERQSDEPFDVDPLVFLRYKARHLKIRVKLTMTTEGCLEMLKAQQCGILNISRKEGWSISCDTSNIDRSAVISHFPMKVNHLLDRSGEQEILLTYSIRIHRNIDFWWTEREFCINPNPCRNWNCNYWTEH